MIRVVVVVYVLIIHVVLFAAVTNAQYLRHFQILFGFRSAELEVFYNATAAFYERVDRSLPSGSILFVGDSHIQGLAVTAVSPYGVNFGIGGDTTLGLFKRLKKYESIARSEAVVLEIGFNDIGSRSNEYILNNIEKILFFLPSNVRVVLCAINPVGDEIYLDYGARIAKINTSLEQLALRFENVEYLDSFSSALSSKGGLRKEYLLADGVHLSAAGYELWIDKLSAALDSGGYVW